MSNHTSQIGAKAGHFAQGLRANSTRLLHEYEWRVPNDLPFKNASPFGIVLGPFRGKTTGSAHSCRAAMEFEELDTGVAQDEDE